MIQSIGRVTTSHSPRIVSVISGKGGVGKSVIAYNLAERLVALGLRVLLIDTDFSSGNLHILANCICDVGIKQYITGELSLQKAITKLAPNFDLLAAPPTGTNTELFNISTIIKSMKQLRRETAQYDFVIIDHSSGISQTASIIAVASDLNLLVIIPEITSIADGYGLYKHLLSLNPKVACRLLINRIADNNEIKFVSLKLSAVTEQFLAHPLISIGAIPDDDAVRRGVAGQTTLAAIDAASPALKALTKLAEKLKRGAGKNFQAALNIEKSINNEPAVADIKG